MMAFLGCCSIYSVSAQQASAIGVQRPPDFITFLRHHMAHIENQLITSNNWVVLGGASEKHVPL